MKHQLVIPGTIAVNSIVRKLGKLAMLLYIVTSFVANAEVLPQSVISICLYAFVFLGAVSLVVSKSLVVHNLYVVWYGIFCASSFVWVPISLSYWPGNVWGDTIYQMAVGLLISLAFTQFLKSKKDINLLAYAYVLSAVLLMILLAVQGRLEEDDRLGETVMGNANTFATMYMVAVIFAFWLLLNRKKILERLLLCVAVAVIFYGLLLSGGRKFILVPFLVLYIMLLLRKDKRGRSHIIRYTVLIAVLLLGLIWLMMENEMLYEVVGYRMEYLFNMLRGEGAIGASNAMRKNLMNLAFEKGFESPIWGHGFDSFKNLAQQKLNFYAYSHNNWTEIWYNYGLIGLIAYYWLYVKLAIGLWKLKKVAPDMASFGIACIVSIFVFEYGAVSYYMYPVQMLLCVVGVMYFLSLKENANGKD